MKSKELQHASFRTGTATVLVLSSEMWGTSWLTKHNYAATLACLGNRVLYVNPCSRKVRFSKVSTFDVPVEQRRGRGTVTVVDTALPVPGRVREWDLRLRSIVMRWPARLIREHLATPADFVIDFGSQFPDLKQFRPAVPIYFPVDEVDAAESLLTLRSPRPKGCELMFSVSDSIISSFRNLHVPAFNLGHGLNDSFAAVAEEVLARSSLPERRPSSTKRVLHVGYIGNIGSKFLDIDSVTQIIQRHSRINFEFFGPFEAGNTNLGFSATTPLVVNQLRACPNVVLHGPVPPEQLARRIRHIDLWLLCYRPELSCGRACNSHKLLEYMATGKCIVSNPMRILEEKPFSSLVLFPAGASQTILDVFANAVANIHTLNDASQQRSRASFALSRSYSLLVGEMEKIVTARRQADAQISLCVS